MGINSKLVSTQNIPKYIREIHINTHILLIYVDSFNSLEYFVMHSPSDGSGLWNCIYVEISDPKLTRGICFSPILLWFFFQSVTCLYYCSVLDHGHFQNPTFEKTRSIITWHIRINKVRYIGKKGPLVCIIATRFHVTQSIYFRIYIELKIVIVLQIEWNFVYKKAEPKLGIFIFLIPIFLIFC